MTFFLPLVASLNQWNSQLKYKPIFTFLKMEKFDEVNLFGCIKKFIPKKTEELSWKQQILRKLQQEKQLTEWSVKLSREAKKGRLKALKKELILDI